MRETPTIVDAGHQHSTYSLANMAQPMFVGHVGQLTTPTATDSLALQALGPPGGMSAFAGYKSDIEAATRMALYPALTSPQKKETPVAEKISCRVVQVYIADPDDNVPLESRMLFQGSTKITDLTDQELFFELDIKRMLDTHNAKRVKLVNKKVKERTEYLEPARVRDLKMVVVNLATF